MKNIKFAFLKRRSELQNIFIVILCITVILEVSHLWFVNLANGQSIFDNTTKIVVQDDTKNSFLQPQRILNAISYNTFNTAYNGDAYNTVFNIGNEILYNASENGEFIETNSYNIELLENNSLIIFDYSYLLDGKTIQQALGITNNFYNRVKDFDKIYFIVDESIDVYLVDSEGSLYYKVTLKNSSLSESLLDASSSIFSNTTYSYILDDSSIVQNLELVANIDNNFSYNEITKTNPFATEYGDSPRNLVESKIEKYFSNTLYMQFAPIDTAYVFSDTDTVVKYFNNGTLEYSYYNIGTEATEYSTLEAYAIAKAFLEKDDDIINDYRLKSYTTNNSDITFEFNYFINNYPIIIETEDNLTDVAFTVVVKNGIVSNYKKIVNNFEVSENTTNASKSFYNAINIFAAPKDEKQIDSVSLGYKSNNEGIDLTLYWFMNAFSSKTSLSTY